MIEPNFTVHAEDTSKTFGKFTYEPLNTGFGNSIGNALRRTLLSALPGYAASYVKFEDASHVFTTIKGVKESVLDIVLNLKQVRFKGQGEGPFKLKLSLKGPQKVHAKQLEGDIDIVNGDLYLAEITDTKGKLELEVIVEKGYGYQACETKEKMTGYIALDSSYSPVVKVNFKIAEARVGRRSDFEKMIIEVTTDGSVGPSETLKMSAKLLAQHFSLIEEGKEFSKPETSEEKTEEREHLKVYETIIDELNLPSRVINALLRENIETVADLVDRGREELTNLKGVGKKSIDLIDEELKKMNVTLE